MRKLYRVTLTALVTCCVLLCAYTTNAYIQKVKSISDVLTEVEKLAPSVKIGDLLVVFDIDMTLVQPDHSAADYRVMRQYQPIFREMFRKISTEDRNKVMTYLTYAVPHKLVEGELTLKVVKAVQEKVPHTIALTTTLSTYNRYFDLYRMGIDFSKSLSFFDQRQVEPIKLGNFKLYAGGVPMFMNGILYTNGGNTDKGTAFVSFLKFLGITPRIIIVLDDKYKNLKDIDFALNSYDPRIKFIGLEYEAVIYNNRNITQEDFERFWLELIDKALSDAKLQT